MRNPFLRQRWTAPLKVALLFAFAAAFARAGNYTTLYSFTGEADGKRPVSALIHDSAGNLYGSTQGGGASGCSEGCGVLFMLDPAGNYTVLHTFNGTDGGHPDGALVRDASGNLYGAAFDGGQGVCFDNLGCGVIFKLDSAGNYTVLYSFSGPDGGNPSGVARGSAGNLYGTTVYGGSQNAGVVFKLDPAGNFTLLHDCTLNGTSGAYPYGGLILDESGNVYGTTYEGGSASDGIVFEIDSAGSFTVLHSFTGADGQNPWAGVIRDPAGNLYGTTTSGGANAEGTLFKLDPAGNLTVLHSFEGTAKTEAVADAGVIRDAAGNLYGAISGGGAHGLGAVYKLDASGDYAVLHSFTADQGMYPRGGLLRFGGKLYGTTLGGGTSGVGVVFTLR